MDIDNLLLNLEITIDKSNENKRTKLVIQCYKRQVNLEVFYER